MKRVNMILAYKIGDESLALSKAKELYKQWETKGDPADELVIEIHPRYD